MKPGHELDELIAQKVFGAIRKINDCSIYEVKHYSTDISAAFEVIEKLLEKNFRLNIMPAEKDSWIISVVKGWDLEPIHVVHSKTPSHAICLAALKAIGYKAAP